MSSYYEKILATGEVKCIDEEVPFEIPASWSWARLTHVTYLIEDCPHSTAKDEGKGYPLVRTPNIGFGFLQLNGVHRVSEKVYNQRNVRAVPQKDDLIFAREAPAGNIAVIQNEKVCLGQRTVLLRPITDCILPQYLAYYVLAPSSQQNLVEKSSGTTVAHVNLSDFRPYLIAVPPIDEQKQIVNKLIELLSLIDKYNCYGDKLAKLNNEIYTLLKKSILQEAIQGKLVPQIIEDGTAYELLEQIKAEKQNLVKEGKLKKSALATSVIFRGDDNRYYEKIGKKCV
ncbi:restriction endonuclease subunit S, partial [Prevotella sp.]|uniref:restriction endonuclease subunit S n=1 Tax=Prevotella sp. TaxID=59823 RepID=UPI00307F6687